MLNRSQADVAFLLKEKDAIVGRWIERVNTQVNSRFFNGSELDHSFIAQFFDDLVAAVDRNIYRDLNTTFDQLVQHERRDGYTVKDVKEFMFAFVPSAVDVLEKDYRESTTYELVLQRLRNVEASLRGVYSERAARGLLGVVLRQRLEICQRWVDELPTPIISNHFAVIARDDRAAFVERLLGVYDALLRGEEREPTNGDGHAKRGRLETFLRETIDFYEPKGFAISDMLRALTHLGRLVEPHLAREFARNFTEYRIAWLSLQDAMDTLSLSFAFEYNERQMKNYYNEVSIMLHRIKNKLTSCPTTLQTILMIPADTGDGEMMGGDPLITTVEESVLLGEYNDVRRAVIEAVKHLVDFVQDPAQLSSTDAQVKFAAIKAAWEPCAAFLSKNETQVSSAEFKLDSGNMEMIHELLMMAYDGGNMTTELTRELQLRQNELYQREPPKHKEIDFHHMVKRAFDECAVEAATKDLQYSFEGHDEGIYVFGVEKELKRPFVQMIENAIKYTPERGAVQVTVRPEDGSICFAVHDTGIGIPPGEEDLVFGLCERCSNAKDFNKNGTGTGLYNDRKVIRHHNGDVWVKSEGEGKGSTFHIRLPIFRRVAGGFAVAN